jgi:hypothetical protein
MQLETFLMGTQHGNAMHYPSVLGALFTRQTVASGVGTVAGVW